MKIAAKTRLWTNTPLRAWLQPLCAVAALVLVAGLFIGGAQPVAVGLFTPPWDKVAHGLVFGLLALLLASGPACRAGWAVVLLLIE